MSKIIISSGWTTANGYATDRSKRVKYLYPDDKILAVSIIVIVAVIGVIIRKYS